MEFQNFIGFLAFLLTATMAFWLLIFLMLFLPYWITLSILDKTNPELAAKLAGFKDKVTDKISNK